MKGGALEQFTLVKLTLAQVWKESFSTSVPHLRIPVSKQSDAPACFIRSKPIIPSNDDKSDKTKNVAVILKIETRHFSVM